MNANTLRYEQVGPWIVSTVKLPIDHGTPMRPLWYETMVFHAGFDGLPASMDDYDCQRCTTELEAIKQHERIVAAWREVPWTEQH